MRQYASLAFALILAASFPARAAFHLFSINEVYTNASGSVQYVELTALAGGQQFTSGHTLVVMGTNGSSSTCSSSPNLPGDTSGRKMLFGTAGVSAAFGVTPDYICPNGFVAIGGGTIDWGEGANTLTYTALPTNGQAISRQGTQQAPTPQNFANVIGTPQAPATPAYQGMWWVANGAEAGWGLETAHQGDVLFVTWFTYGADGNNAWFLISNAAKVSDGKYTGDIYTYRGNPFNSVPWDSTQTIPTMVGTGTLTFSSPTAGTFQYTVNGISQTKNLVRFEFSTPIPSCTAGGTASGATNYQDIWWKSPGGSESGWGLNIVHQGDQMFLSWFTYDATGKAQWLAMPDFRRTTGENFTGSIFRYRGNAFSSAPWATSSITSTNVGTATLAFTDRNNGTFSYTLDGISQTKAITRTVFIPAGPASSCNYP